MTCECQVENRESTEAEGRGHAVGAAAHRHLLEAFVVWSAMWHRSHHAAHCRCDDVRVGADRATDAAHTSRT